VTKIAGSGSTSQRLGSADPDPHQNVMDPKHMRYVRPHLEFSSPACSTWTETDKAVLKKIQGSAVFMVSGLKGESYEEKLE
jgi:hypothetical protein